MLRTYSFLATMTLLAVVNNGCGTSTATPPTASLSRGQQYLLPTEPVDAVGVLQAKENAKDGEQLLLVGRIGGGQKPWIDGRAAFLLVDDGVAPTCSEEHCEEGCAECALALAEATTLVKFVDENSKVLPTDARELLGVENFQTVVVRGVAARDKAGNLSVIADGIYIRR